MEVILDDIPDKIEMNRPEKWIPTNDKYPLSSTRADLLEMANPLFLVDIFSRILMWDLYERFPFLVDTEHRF